MRRILYKFPLCLLLLLTIMALPALSSTVHAAAAAQGNGKITGQLVNGTHKNAPVAGETVTLQTAQGQKSQDYATAKTDAQGNFSFEQLPTDKTINYAVYIRYQGTQYTSDVVTLDSKPVQQFKLVVYDATSDPSNVAITGSTVLVQEPDAQKGILTISQIYIFRNLGAQAFVGSLDASKGKPKALFFSLPANVKNITLDDGFNGYRSIQIGDGFASEAALLPGITEYTISYQVSYTGSSYDFRYHAMYPTVELTVMVPTSLHASSNELKSNGVVTANQHPYEQYKTLGLRTDNEVHVQIQGLPAVAAQEPPTRINPLLVWLIVAGVLLLAVLGIIWFLYTTRKRQATKLPRTTVTKKGTPARAEKTKQVERPKKDAGDQQQALLQELLQLDRAYEAGKINKATYQERRARTKARLRAILSEQEEATRR